MTFLLAQHLEIIQGNDYKAADSRALRFLGVGISWPSAGTSVKLLIKAYAQGCSAALPPVLEIDGTYTPATTGVPALAAFDLPRVQTLALATGVRAHTLEVRAVLATGSVVTLSRGHLTVLPGVL